MKLPPYNIQTRRHGVWKSIPHDDHNQAEDDPVLFLSHDVSQGMVRGEDVLFDDGGGETWYGSGSKDKV